jgi:hypothetical protein
MWRPPTWQKLGTSLPQGGPSQPFGLGEFSVEDLWCRKTKIEMNGRCLLQIARKFSAIWVTWMEKKKVGGRGAGVWASPIGVFFDLNSMFEYQLVYSLISIQCSNII